MPLIAIFGFEQVDEVLISCFLKDFIVEAIPLGTMFDSLTMFN